MEDFNLAIIESNLGYKLNEDEIAYAQWLNLAGFSLAEIIKITRR